MGLPKFKYHPDPIKTGAVAKSRNTCKCCGNKRGFIYKLDPYGTHKDLSESICPWCIQSGDAHQKLSVTFNDEYPLSQAGLDGYIIDEIVNRTPGYESWQGDHWVAHCNDACEFLGDAEKKDLKNISNDKAEVIDSDIWGEDQIKEFIEYYEPKGSPAFYKFRCIHCRKVLYYVDAN